jgi:hypothetical protein
MDRITSLKSLATRVNAAHTAFISSGQGAVEKAIEVGRLLLREIRGIEQLARLRDVLAAMCQDRG